MTLRIGYDTQEWVTPETQDARTFCRYHPLGHSDAAKRAADQVNLHRAVLGWNAVGKWVAVALSDGSSDGTAYDNKADAVRHQSDELRYAYIRMIGMVADICEMETFLEVHRKMYDSGFRMADPDHKAGGRHYVYPNRVDARRQVLEILRNARRGGQ